MGKIDQLLAEVANEAAALKIPVSAHVQREVEINHRAKRRFGCCKKKSDGYTIEISAVLLESDTFLLKQILAHELLHTCPGCGNHGAAWKGWAQKMNDAYGYRIKRTSSQEDLGLAPEQAEIRERIAKYIFVCASCGAEIRRSRVCRLVKYPHLYRCRCGGRLKRV